MGKFAGALALGLMVLSPSAMAKTFYVETFGDDDGNANFDCSKTAPCASITHVIDNVAGDNDRILVGPGSYPGHFVINQNGLRLLSVAGARVTKLLIEGASIDPDGAGVEIYGDKVRIGQKGHGFTIEEGDSDGFNNEDGIYIDADKVRIEGNVLIGPGSGSDAVIETDGLNTTIRYNRLSNFSYGIFSALQGFPTKHNISENDMSDIRLGCVYIGAGDASRNIIAKNTFSDCNLIASDNDCVAVDAGARSNNRFTQNVLSGCWNGFHVKNQSGEKSGDKYVNNVIKDIQNIAINIEDGNPLVSKNLLLDVYAGTTLLNTSGAQVKDNMMQNVTESAHSHFTQENTVFSGNTVQNVGTVLGAIQVAGGGEATPFRKFSNNNFLDINSCAIAFVTTPTLEWELKNNFWGDLSSPDGIPAVDCLNANAQTALDNNLLQFDPATKANPIKYRSGL